MCACGKYFFLLKFFFSWQTQIYHWKTGYVKNMRLDSTSPLRLFVNIKCKYSPLFSSVQIKKCYNYKILLSFYNTCWLSLWLEIGKSGIRKWRNVPCASKKSRALGPYNFFTLPLKIILRDITRISIIRHNLCVLHISPFVQKIFEVILKFLWSFVNV